MKPALALLVLVFAALLEVGGDALIRLGLHQPNLLQRLGLLCLGGMVLVAYGLVVNLPNWDFGRLLGVYVAVFFAIAQLVNLFVFGQRPAFFTLMGGTLIILGGLIVAFSNR